MSHEILEADVVKIWKKTEHDIILVFREGKGAFFVKDKNSITAIPHYDAEGIPRDILLSKEVLEKYVEHCSATRGCFDNGQSKIYVSPQLFGGANIIDPDLQPGQLWPNGIVPYEIDSTKYPVATREREIIKSAIAEWNNAQTGFQFVPRTDARDYLIFGEHPSACYSKFGRVGNGQYIRCHLEGSFNKGSIIHEMGHAIGFYHEQQRNDRNNYVTVNSKDAVNYGITGKPYGKYDLNSIMHYYFDVNMRPKPGITNPDAVGTQGILSAGDKAAASYLYQKSLQQNVPVNPTVQLTPSTTAHIGSSLYGRSIKRPEWQVLNMKADRFFENGEFVDAYRHAAALLAEYDGSLDINFQSTLQNLCGACAMNIGEYEFAMRHLNRALELDPTNKVALKNKAVNQQAIAQQQSQCVLL